MPEIKVKHVVTFSSEDKVYKADNLIKPETYRKWKCATPGEKSATVVLQFEKAAQINSIDIGNESSAFIEVQVGRCCDATNDFKNLLAAASFMSPMESKNETHTNRVRMFGSEKFSHTTKDEKWDCVKIVCTQPFNTKITYGLTFVKFHTNEKIEESSEAKSTTTGIGALNLKYLDEDESLSIVGSYFQKQNTQVCLPINKKGLTYASVLLDSSNSTKMSLQADPQKRKTDEIKTLSDEPPTKKAGRIIFKEDDIDYKDVFRNVPESEKALETSNDLKTEPSGLKSPEIKKITVVTPSNKTAATSSSRKQTIAAISSKPHTATPLRKPITPPLSKPTAANKPVKTNENKPFKVPFEKIMDQVVFVLSGFINPLRSELRDKALEMGAKYKCDWDTSCTHLVCAFSNTPKNEQVKKLSGRIVTKEWILESYKKKRQIPWTHYILDQKSSRDSSTESDYSDLTDELENSEEEYVDKKKKQINVKKTKSKPADTSKKDETCSPINKIRIPNKTILSASSHSKTPMKRKTFSDNSQSPTLLDVKDESETDDEQALQDYNADTDKDSGEDTEDEILRVEKEIFKNKAGPSKNPKFPKENYEYSEKPDVTDLPVPELPNLFKQKHFFLYRDFSSSKHHDLNRYIVGYNGVIENYMSTSVKYVVTDAKWDKNFDNALNDNEDLIFVKPTWIYKCHEAGKLVPYQPYIVIPGS